MLYRIFGNLKSKLLFIFLSLVLLLSACKDKKEYAKRIMEANILNYCVSMQYNGSFDPARVFDTREQSYVAPMYEALYLKNKGILANSVRVSKDGLTYIYYLRNDIQFHTTRYFKPTRNMNAEDVMFSLNRLLNQSSFFYHPNVENNVLNKMRQNISSISKIGEYAIKIVFKKPYNLLAVMNNIRFSVLSKEYADYLQDNDRSNKFFNYPIGTGPWKFKEINDNRVIYERNESYWGNKTETKKLVIKYIKNISQDLSYITKSRCDIMDSEDDSLLANIFEKYNVKINTVQEPSVTMMLINSYHNKTLNNPLIRQAIAHVIDKDYIIRKITKGYGIKANSIVPISVNGNFNRQLPYYQYDIEQAKELLKQAGHPDGTGLPTMSYKVNQSNYRSILVAKYIQQQLDLIGIHISIEKETLGELNRHINKNDYDFVLIKYYSMSQDMSEYLYLLNDMYNMPPETGIDINIDELKRHRIMYNSIINQIEFSNNSDVRKQLAYAIQETILRNIDVIPLFYGEKHIIFKDNIYDVESNYDSIGIFSKVNKIIAQKK